MDTKGTPSEGIHAEKIMPCSLHGHNDINLTSGGRLELVMTGEMPYGNYDFAGAPSKRYNSMQGGV